ncbi:excinuclease ABC subunit B [Flavobacterium salilacus subsp. salilacus]|uniref:excinuclease ABC subunit B n=1 Tax=Flavobacterium TaxID=237 RepID=UPI00107588E4|nr:MULTISPECIES: excinuclease ABC subunit B [Flavobacterium]KAF2518712.1 excinuclease ABC subunit B [Flavobacterium salilacus subsp. salilacus]MBE1613677.1 excinuclease ABC subunit B [Flavobacterium sp. SaA2.13]NDI99097.1 excinuclease ABC subunit B [Flavobacterium salilacus subsp. altitudinum]
MSTYEEKLSLLSEMIAFAQIDGQVHDREYQLLAIVASQLKIEQSVFEELFEKKAKKVVIKSEYERIMQFYRLALLMHADGTLHINEQIAIREMGVNMGLSPYAMRSVLAEMQKSSTGLIDPGVLLALFRAQHN